MRLMHLADLHLGARRYQRMTPAGINQREQDVADAFRRAVDIVIARAPEIVVIAGDVFESVRPGNAAIIHTFEQLGRLTHALPDTIVVMISGNHDTPRAADTGCLLPLFGSLGIHIAAHEATRFDFPDRALSILAIPECVGEHPTFAPNPDATTNILLTHLEVTDVFAGIPLGGEERKKGLAASIAEMGPERWGYIAVGHYHVTRELAPNCFYAGSLEYTSSNVWGELEDEFRAGLRGKRLIEYDLEQRTHRFHPIPHNRQLIELPTIGAHGMSARDLDDAIQASAGAAAIDGAIVRQRVLDCPVALRREIDFKATRALERRALDYQLDWRKAEVVRMRGTPSARRRLQPLPEMVIEFLGNRVITNDIPREMLTASALDYLGQAEAMESRKPQDAMIDPDSVADSAPHTWALQFVQHLGCEVEVCTACEQVRHQFEDENRGCPGKVVSRALEPAAGRSNNGLTREAAA